MENKNIDVITAFTTFYPPTNVMSIHNHTFFHYIYVCAGDGEISIGKVNIKLKSGMIYLVSPLTMHTFISGKKGLSTYEVKFNITNKSLYDRALLLPTFLDAKNTDVKYILKKMTLEASNVDEFSKSMIDIKFNEFLTTLFRLNLLKKQDENDLKIGSDRFSEIIGYINQNIQSQITLNELANIVHMDSIYFLKQFKKVTGTTPMAYVRNARISQAKNLLLHSDMNITQISLAVGFQSIHHFSSAFKKIVGVSPAVFKEKNLNK